MPSSQVPTSAEWRVATVRQIRPETPDVRTYTFAFDEPVRHASGQYYEIRLTAEDGYQAARLYSAATPASGHSNVLQLTIALMPYGEVSPYVFRSVKIDSQLEIRGPLGRHFVWSPAQTEPVLLVGGGTGVIPLRSMWREHMVVQARSQMVLLYSVSDFSDLIYMSELLPEWSEMPPENVILTFSSRAPRNWMGYHRRIDAPMMAEVLERFSAPPSCYVCGPTPFVETSTQLLVEAGIPDQTIKAERFGPTG